LPGLKWAACRAEDALKNREVRTITRLTEGHDDAGDDEGREKLQQADADAPHEAEHRFGDVAELRLQALHQRRQIGVRLGPDGMQLRANERPGGHGVTRRRYFKRIRLNVPDELMHRVPQRTHQYGRRRDDQRETQDRDQRGRQTVAATDPAGHGLIQRIQGHREDQRPQQQGQERRECPVTQQDQERHQAKADEDIHDP